MLDLKDLKPAIDKLRVTISKEEEVLKSLKYKTETKKESSENMYFPDASTWLDLPIQALAEMVQEQYDAHVKELAKLEAAYKQLQEMLSGIFDE